MLNILEKIIKGKSRNLNENLNKYGLYPSNVKRFWKDRNNKEIIFVTIYGTIILKNNWDSLEIYEFLKSSNVFLWGINQYINIGLVKCTQKYFLQRTVKYYLRVHFTDNTYVEFSDHQPPHLKDLDIQIRSLIN